MSYNDIVKFLLNFDKTNIQQKYKDYLKKVRPMTGAGVAQLLNGCASLIDDDKCYLEIGTHRGSTLLAASLDNKTVCYGVDNFSGHTNTNECEPFSSIEEGLQDAIKRLSNGNVKYFKEDYLKFFEDRLDIEGRKVEVYLYDGDHMEESQYLGVKKCVPLLADKAIILIDDSGQGDRTAVWNSIDKIVKEQPEITVLKEFIQDRDNDLDGMWCGIVALKFERSK
jgi:hypothetical protein